MPLKAGGRPKPTAGASLLSRLGKSLLADCRSRIRRVLGERLYFLQSGSGTLDYLDLTTGRIATVSSLPGIARGLAIHAGYAFIGLSKARPSLEGVPIVADREKLLCGLSVIDLNSGLQVAFWNFKRVSTNSLIFKFFPELRFPLSPVPGPSEIAASPSGRYRRWGNEASLDSKYPRQNISLT